MRIVFDLDGVLRDINGYLNTKLNIPYPQEWFWKYQDKDIFDWIKQDNYFPLIYAPATDYFLLVKHCFEKPEIWTCQPEEWKEKTKLWLDIHFREPAHQGGDYEVKYLDNAQKRELLDESPDTWLVEDNPLFSHWDRILLIDQPYNRHIQDAIRIQNLGDLDAWLWRMLKVNSVKYEKV